MQTINAETKVPISLNRIIDYILDNLEEDRPAFVQGCDHKISKELYGYTKKILEMAKENRPDIPLDEGVKNIPLDEKVTEAVETKASKLLDGICEANGAYLEAGIHIGANLLWQLLDI